MVVDAAEPLSACTVRSLQRNLQACDQRWRGKRFCKKTDRARLDGASTDCFIGEGRDKYERRVMAEAAHMPEKIKSVHARHLDIGDHAGSIAQFRRVEKFISGDKGVDDVPVRRQKVVCCVAN